MFNNHGAQFLTMFKELDENINDQMLDDNPKFTFVDRLAEHLRKELGWSKHNATDLAISVNYDVNDVGRAIEEYDEIEKIFFSLLVKVLRRYQERFPDCTLQGLIAAASSMEFQLNL